jgi:hypothetical protein
MDVEDSAFWDHFPKEKPCFSPPPAFPRHHHQPLVPLRGDQQRPRRTELEGSRFEGQGGEDLEATSAGDAIGEWMGLMGAIPLRLGDLVGYIYR